MDLEKNWKIGGREVWSRPRGMGTKCEDTFVLCKCPPNGNHSRQVLNDHVDKMAQYVNARESLLSYSSPY